MKVSKRNGQLQDFNLEKIKTSLACTSNDIREPLNKSDLDNISTMVEENIHNKFSGQITYVDVHNVVFSTLKDMGFTDMAKAYNEFEMSFVNK